MIDDLHISHNALGIEANIQVLLIHNSSSHSSLVVTGLELQCLAGNIVFVQDYGYQGSLLMCSWC